MLLTPFRTLLVRLSREITTEDLESLIFSLQDHIPAGTLEGCTSAKKLFTCMTREGLLGENNLDFLEELFAEVPRSDLVDRIKVFKGEFSAHRDCDSPAMELVRFSIVAQNKDIESAKNELFSSMCTALPINSQEMCCLGSQQACDWFDLTFEIPNRQELLKKLRDDAITKAKWLVDCTVRSVTIDKESQIVLQPVAPSASSENVSSSECIHSDKKLDMILVIDCATSNPIILSHLKTQLAHVVDAILKSKSPLQFRLALVSYQNHQMPTKKQKRSQPVHCSAFLQKFTSNKEEMLTNIKNLRCYGKKGSRKGLADGLALAVRLSEGVNGDDFKCRKEAVKVCILLPLEDPRGSLDIFRCTHGHDVTRLCGDLAGNSVSLYTVMGKTLKAAPSNLPNPVAHDLMAQFFTGMSLKTGGFFIYTQNLKLISQIIVLAIEEDISIERLFGTAHDIVIQEITTNSGEVDLEELRDKLEDALNRRFCNVNLITFNGSTIGPSSEMAKKFSLDGGIDSACQTFRSEIKRMSQCITTAPQTPSDVVDMEETTNAQVSLAKNLEISSEVSERMLQRVVLRKQQYWPRYKKPEN